MNAHIPVYFQRTPGAEREKRLSFAFIRKSWLHVLLFVLTALSTLTLHGPWYAVGILSILFAHEMGHYLMCVRHGVKATLPFFLPGIYVPFLGWLSPFGTFGAVIRMRPPIRDRKALFDIGAAGPIAGFVVTLVCLVAGYRLSKVMDAATMPDAIRLGDSFLSSFVSRLTFGTISEGHDILLHPLAFAGWVGLFVTGLNLIPIGQLDGGHVVYSVFGRKSRWIYAIALTGLMAVQLLVYPYWNVLIFLIVLIIFRHPPVVDEIQEIGAARRLLAVLCLLIFALTFMPIPFIVDFSW